MVNTTYNITNLPLDISRLIISQLDLKTLFSISSACKVMQSAGSIIASSILRDRRITQLDHVSPLIQLIDNLKTHCTCLNEVIGIKPEKNLFSNLAKLNEVLTKSETKLTQTANNLIISCTKVMPCKAGAEKDEKLRILIESGAKISSLLNCLQAGFLPEIIEMLLSQDTHSDKINADHIVAACLNNYPANIINALTHKQLSQDAYQILSTCDYFCDKVDTEKEIQIQALVNKGAEISSLCTCLHARFSPDLIENILKRDCYTGEVTLTHIKIAITRQYPNYIILALTSKLDENKLSNDQIADSLSHIISSEIPHETIINIIRTIKSIPARYIDMFLWTKQIPEPILLALLEKASTGSNELAATIWDLVVNKETYTQVTLKKILDINTKSGISFPLYKYDIKFCTKLYNDSLVISLVDNQSTLSLNILDDALRYALSPQTILHIYKKIPPLGRGMRESSRESGIRLEALRFLFRSGHGEIIQELSLMNEHPGWDDIRHAIEAKQPETTLHFLLDAYEKEETSEHGSCGYHFTSYAHFLYSALEYDLSDSMVEKILNKVSMIHPGTIELALEKGRSSVLISKLENKRG